MTAISDSAAAVDLLRSAQDHERDGAIADAIACYEGAIASAERAGAHPVLAEALRRFAIVQHHRGDAHYARRLCLRSYDVARLIDNAPLAAEALNTLGVMDLSVGALHESRAAFLRALELDGDGRALRARVEQNLGILANIRGELDEALRRYRRSLEAYDSVGDEHGCALAYHNLGMVSADRGDHAKAERYFQESRAIALRLGDLYLQGACLVNFAEVDVARQRFENARQHAEMALAIFDQIEANGPRADANRVLGVIYRETGHPQPAEARLRNAIRLAAVARSALHEAEASQELALLYQGLGRNQEALSLLNAAYHLFGKVEAHADLVNVGAKMAALEGTYLAVVRGWGQSIESTDTYTFGHCERVAQNAVALARELGLSEQDEKTILLGAYLHDVGKVRVPRTILHKAGPLTAAERLVVRQHTTWGVALLANIEFPWDIVPIIRWHHERYDGSGYPDGLVGDDIPIGAQIVGILDTYDALTTARPYQAAMTPQEALDYILRFRGWWSERVVNAFWRALSQSSMQARAGGSVVGQNG